MNMLEEQRIALAKQAKADAEWREDRLNDDREWRANQDTKQNEQHNTDLLYRRLSWIAALLTGVIGVWFGKMLSTQPPTAPPVVNVQPAPVSVLIQPQPAATASAGHESTAPVTTGPAK
jgi:hypothetical protein